MVTKITLSVIAFVVVSSLFLVFSGPILLSFHTGPMVGDTEFVIFNPFRNRAPERSAEGFLEHLKTGRCEEVIGIIPGDEKAHKYICEREKQFPIVSWRLREIDAEGGIVSLLYRYRCEGRPDEDRLFIWVEKKNGNWIVANYKRGY